MSELTLTRWQRLLTSPERQQLLVPVLSVTGALLLCFGALAATGRDPFAAFASMLGGGLGSLRAIGDASVKISVLTLTGLSVAVAFSVGLFNTGAEGQLVVGAICAAWIGQAVELPAPLHLPLALAAAALGGGLYGVIPAWLKVRRGVHEVISTIMLNWIAIHLVENWLVLGPLAARSTESSLSLPGTRQIAESAELPRFLAGSELGAGIVIALGAAALLAFLLDRTWLGFELRATGSSVEASRTAGIDVASRTCIAMGLAGACAGLAGALLILGVHKQYPSVFHAGYGFDGIAISLIGANHPLGVLASALFFGVIRAGGTRLQLLHIHRSFPELIQGIALLFIAGQMITRHGLGWLGRPRAKPAPVAPPASSVEPR